MAIRCGGHFKAWHWPRVSSCVAVAACLILVTLEPSFGQGRRRENAAGPAYRNTAPGVRYVGSKMCAGCHSAIYQEFSRTAMAHSTFLPGKILELGWLPKAVDIFNEKHNRHYQIFVRDGKIYESEYGLDDEGNIGFRHTEELAYMVGTGVNGDTPVVRRGNYLFEAPLSYYAATKSWALSPNFDVRDMGFNLPITADCMGCHAGRTQPVLGREGLYRDPPVVDLGISCENCHGPGELHVNERLAGVPVGGRIDRSIVNPAKLSPWLADNICMSCHEGDIRALQPGKFDSDFRPGTPLNDTVAIVKAPIDPQAAQSPLLEHYYSMTLSKCYRATNGKLGCQSCHDPHIQPSAAEAPAYFRGKCLTCHAEKSCTFDLQKRLAQKPADACTNCHMPKRPALTVSHSSLTDHRILRVRGEPFPEVALAPSLPGTGLIHVNAIPGEPDRIPAVVLLKAYRKELIRGDLQFKDYYFALLDRLSKAGSDDPFVLSAIAQKAGSDGDLPKAIRYAREVVARGSASDSDYLLLDQFLARSGNLAGSINVLKKGISTAPYSNSLYDSLAHRQLSAGNINEGMATLTRGLELFPEDSTLRSMQQQTEGNRHVQEGIARFKKGDSQSALNEFQAAVQADPGNAVAHDYIGVIEGEAGKLEVAVAEFQQATRLDHALADPYFHLGLAYSRMGRTPDAIHEYQEALRLNPAMPQAQYGLSAICAKLGDLDGAIGLLRQVVGAAPDFAEARYNLGINLWNRYKNSAGLRQKSDLDDAAQELKKASGLEPRQPAVWFALGQLLADRGDLGPAVGNLQKAVALQPSNPQYHYDLGLALRLKGNLEEAGNEFRAALQLDPQHALAHRSLGLVLRESGHLQEAEQELRLSVAELPNDAEGHHLLGTVLFKLNELNGAIEEFRKAISLDPSLTDARATLAQALQKAGRKQEALQVTAELQQINLQNSNLGQAMILVETAAAHSKKKEYEAAVSELREATTLSPGFTEAEYQLALALQQSGDRAKAEKAYHRVLALNPNHALAHLRLGELREGDGDKSEAEVELAKAIELAPSLVEAHIALGKLAEDSKDWSTAIHEFESVLAWSPKNAAAHYDLATVLKASGQTEDAERELQIAHDLDPTLSRSR